MAVTALVTALAAILGAVVQSTVVAQIQVFGVCANLPLLLTVSWTLLAGTGYGAIAALAGGLALDALSGGPFGAGTFALLAVALVTGLGEVNLFQWLGLLPYLAVLLGTFIYNAIYLLFLRLAGLYVPWDVAVAEVVLPMIAVNLLGMVIVFGIMRRLVRRPSGTWEMQRP